MLVLAAAVFLASAAAHGLSAMIVWDLVAVQCFHLQPLGYVDSAALALSISAFTGFNTGWDKQDKSMKPEERLAGFVIVSATGFSIRLGVGYIAHLVLLQH